MLLMPKNELMLSLSKSLRSTFWAKPATKIAACNGVTLKYSANNWFFSTTCSTISDL